MDRFWMVLVEGQGVPRYRHLTFEEAKEEAARLLHLPDNRHRPVYILKTVACGYLEQTPVTWKTWTA